MPRYRDKQARTAGADTQILTSSCAGGLADRVLYYVILIAYLRNIVPASSSYMHIRLMPPPSSLSMQVDKPKLYSGSRYTIVLRKSY